MRTPLISGMRPLWHVEKDDLLGEFKTLLAPKQATRARGQISRSIELYLELYLMIHLGAVLGSCT
jgi:hypothetical protein